MVTGEDSRIHPDLFQASKAPGPSVLWTQVNGQSFHWVPEGTPPQTHTSVRMLASSFQRESLKPWRSGGVKWAAVLL
jgi:hypothetical protein